LGIKPSAIYSTVRSRLDNIENSMGTAGVQLGQDLGGTLLAPLVIGLYGKPIIPSTPTTGQVLTWNGVAWDLKYKYDCSCRW